MSNVAKSSTSAEFSVLVQITFFTKIYILRLAMLNYLDAEQDQVKFIQVL